MALNWQAATIPAGSSFTNVLFHFLVPYEASTTAKRWNPTAVESTGTNGTTTYNATIGVGFDMLAGGRTVLTVIASVLQLGVVASGAYRIYGPSGRDINDLNWTEQVDLASGIQVTIRRHARFQEYGVLGLGGASSGPVTVKCDHKVIATLMCRRQ